MNNKGQLISKGKFAAFDFKKTKQQILISAIGPVHMSFDKFILAVESRDLSEADKSIIRVSSWRHTFLLRLTDL